MNLYCTIVYVSVCPLTQIRHLESTLFFHIGKEKLGSNGQGKLIPKLETSSKSNKRAIRSISIIIHVDWSLGKQLKTISKISNEKKWPIHVDLGPKQDLIWKAQINFPYQNFSNLPEERKRPISTLLFINLSKFWRKRKTEHDLY